MNLDNVEEMTQKLSVLATLAKDQGLILNTHIGGSQLVTSIPGDPNPFSGLCRHHSHAWYKI